MALLDSGSYGVGMTPQQAALARFGTTGPSAAPSMAMQPYGSAPALMQPQQLTQAQRQQNGQGTQPGSSPISNYLFGQTGAVGNASQGLLGNGGFQNTMQSYIAPTGGQVGTANMASDGPMAGADFSAMPAAGGAGAAGAGAAGGAASGAAGGAAADAAGGAAADGAGASALGAISVVCTEGVRQGKIPRAHWVHGSRVFAGYSDGAKRTYYFFAIPAVRHMRRKPNSFLTRGLVAIFGAHSEHIAAKAGCPGARRRVVGAITSTALPPIGRILGKLVFREPRDATDLYREAK